jgi:hypothetical protein
MAIVISMSQLASRTGNLSVSALYSATYMGGHNNFNVICKKSAALVIVYIFSVLFIYLFVCSFLVFQAEEEPSVCDNVDQSATRGRRKSVVKRQPIVEANLISENISFNFKFLFLISFARGRRACRHWCPLPSRRSQIPRPQRRSRRSPRRGSSSRRPWSLKKTTRCVLSLKRLLVLMFCHYLALSACPPFSERPRLRWQSHTATPT